MPGVPVEGVLKILSVTDPIKVQISNPLLKPLKKRKLLLGAPASTVPLNHIVTEVIVIYNCTSA